jgi:hypothetical protein
MVRHRVSVIRDRCAERAARRRVAFMESGLSAARPMRLSIAASGTPAPRIPATRRGATLRERSAIPRGNRNANSEKASAPRPGRGASCL